MAIRFRKYKNKSGQIVKALRVNERNVAELEEYILKNGGKATDHSQTFHNPQLKDGVYTAVKLAVVQLCTSASGKTYRGRRVAYAGDIIVRNEVENKDGFLEYEFARIKDADFGEFRAV